MALQLFLEFLLTLFQVIKNLPVSKRRTGWELFLQYGSVVVVLFLQRIVVSNKLERVLVRLFELLLLGFLLCQFGTLSLTLPSLLGQGALLNNVSGLAALNHSASSTDGGKQTNLIRRLAVLSQCVFAKNR